MTGRGRYHRSSAKVEEQAAEKQKAKTTEDHAKHMANEDWKWKKSTEHAFRTHLPAMAAMLDVAKKLKEQANKQNAQESKKAEAIDKNADKK